MKKFAKTIFLAFSLPFICYTHIAYSDPLTLGVFPYVTSAQLIQFHSPLKDYLSKSLGQEVNLVTSPDFPSFIERTQNKEYDIILTAPHFGRLAEKRDGYKPLIMGGSRVQGVFLVKKDSAINSLDDLKNKKIMVVQRTAVIYQLAQQTLAAKGLRNGENITLIETKTHNNAVYAPLRDEADAAVGNHTLWQVLVPEYKDQLKVIGQTNSVPGVIILTHPNVPSKTQHKIQEALINFGKTAEGEAYFKTTAIAGFLPVTAAAMKELDPYITIFTDKH
jgi:phosphonate transport system substrate-binding protein